MLVTWIGVSLQVLHCFYGHSPLVAMGKKCFIHTLGKQNVSKMFPFHFRQEITSTLLPLCMLASNVVLEYWSRHSARITISQIQCPAWGHPQWFVWSGVVFTGETRKCSFPQCLSYGIPHLSKAPEKPSGLLSAQDFPPSHLLPWNSGLNLKSLCDSCAKTGTCLQIITVCPKMHSTLSKKYKTSCVWNLLPSGYCSVFLSWLENWPLRNSDTQ